MKAFEYKRILEECAETAVSEEAKAAYRFSLAAFLMVEIGKPDAAGAEPAGKTDAGRVGSAAGEEKSGEAEVEEREEAARAKQAAGEKQRKPPVFRAKECRNCGKSFTPHYGSQTICVECARAATGQSEAKVKRQDGQLEASDPAYRRKLAEELAAG